MMGGHLSLRAQIIGVTGLAMLCLQVTTVVLLLDERYFTSQIQRVDDATICMIASSKLILITNKYFPSVSVQC